MLAQLICGDSNEEIAANARLIAAAPDMLAILKKIVVSFPGYIPDFVEAANAAIAKAEGEKSATATDCPTEA